VTATVSELTLDTTIAYAVLVADEDVVEKVNRKGCRACKCEAKATTTERATTRGTTTERATTRATTTERATTRATTTARACPTFRPCNCKPGASAHNEVDRNGCTYCSCLADTVTTTGAPRPTTRGTRCACLDWIV
jgi:hypothetical protein